MGLSETKIKVRYVETDQMGIAHHSNYYHWFEVGRTEFIGQIGMTYGEMEQAGVLLPLIESACTYKQGAKYEDELIIRTSIAQLTGARITFGYEVLREKDQKCLAMGKTVHAFVNGDFRPINLKKVNKTIWAGLESVYYSSA
ncbi:MAG: acyl-CoA thioesterase [Firmicutes bacterium]|nr:acyl-CoA thioesterase [Bacillota bacterium]